MFYILGDANLGADNDDFKNFWKWPLIINISVYGKEKRNQKQ